MSHLKAKKHLKKDAGIKNLKVPRIPSFKNGSYFDTLVTSIIYQQISGKAASSIYRRLDSYCNGKITPQKIAKIRPVKLRSLGISPQKTKYIKDLSKKFLNREINTRRFAYQSDEEIIEELTMVKGIGLWTAQMFLIFSLGREDVFPTKDLGIQKAFAKMHGLKKIPSEEKMLKMSEKWKPYRTYASLVLWSSVDTATPKSDW